MIIHFDGDAFFASVEQAKDIRLRGKPVVVGKERGAITSVSYEAKKFGINRGVPMREIKKMCPQVIIAASDYATYSIFANRMYAIVRRFAPVVEEYSIDECFADVTGLDVEYGMSYEELARTMKDTMERELGITYGVGLAPNKVLAKIASKWRKPSGLTAIYPETIIDFIKDLPIGKIWGIGPSTSIALSKLGIVTVLDFASKDDQWLTINHISKPYREIHAELNGKMVKLVGEPDDDIGSIIKSRTFSPPSVDQSFIFSQLSKNIEEACDKARRYGVSVRHISFYLKTQAFIYHSYDVSLPASVSSPQQIIAIARKHFNEVYRKNTLYRATGISLRGLVKEEHITRDLFGEQERLEKVDEVVKHIDTLNTKFGSHTVFLASSLTAFIKERFHDSEKEEEGTNGLLLHEHTSKRLNIPFLGKIIKNRPA